MHGIISNFCVDIWLVKKMGGTLSKTKLTKLMICTLMIATLLQVGAISIVQATDDSLARTTSTAISPDDTVVVSSDAPNLISTEDEPLIMPENGELISPAPENATTPEDQDIEYVKPEDDTTIGITEMNDEENYQPLIAPKATTETESPILGVAVLLVALSVIGMAFLVYKKTR